MNKSLSLLRTAAHLMAFAAVGAACSMDTAPEGLKRAAGGPGPTVRFDLSAKPLPEIPFPNDVATWPDPTSRTGLRVNASLVAPTSIERSAREKFSQLEGWGTYAPITVGFEKASDLPDGATAIDIANVKARHQGDDYDFADDAIYLVNLRTGIPAPIDLGEGSFDYTLRDLHKYWRNDHRITEETLIFETVDEARLAGKPKGTPYAPELDTDFDGVLDVPNLDDPDACPTAKEVAGDPEKELARHRCIADRLLTWYERETDTVIIRPLLPLDEMTEYAVVITDRLVDPKGRPARSPFDFVYHPRQERSIERLQTILRDGSSPYFGDMAGTGLDHVAFAWTFTTQPTVSDLVTLRDGLYGQGPFAKIAEDFPASLELFRAIGPYAPSELAESGMVEPPRDEWAEAPGCKEQGSNLYLMKVDKMQGLLEQVVEQVFEMRGAEKDALLSSWVDNLDYVAMGYFKSPFFVEGGPKGTDPHASFHLNFKTGEGFVTEDEVQFWLLVPKKRDGRSQPFPVSIYGHGYTAFSLSVFTNAGILARQGIASVGINAVGHGLALEPKIQQLAQMLFKGSCLAPAGEALARGRARDLNNDGVADSGGDFWTSYVFHTRDVVRQSVIDWMQFTRILRTFDGKTLSGQDYDGDGKLDLAGDFDGDGVPDIGGPDVPIGTWGQSLGAFISGVHGAVDHNIDASAPVAGGVMTDVGLRSFQGGVVEAVILRMLGPLVVSVPASSFYEDGVVKPGTTKCASHQLSLRFVVPDVNDAAEIEFGCAESTELVPNDATVIVHNLDNGKRRCARTGDEGRFRIGIPSSLGDRLRIEVYAEADYVDSYGECNPKGDRPPVKVIGNWGAGFVAQGASHPVREGETVCNDAPSCTHFQGRYYAEGSALTAPADGYGFTRQSPDLRRFLGLAQTVLDPADAVTFMPHYALKPLRDPWGRPMPPRGLLDVQTIGDMNVPISAGIAYGRAAGALPFFTAEQGRKYPEYVDYATPTALLSELPGGTTPNRLLIDQYVVEGINRLERHPVDLARCARNMSVDTSNLACHPRGCVEDPGVCLRGQVCDEASDTCVAAPPDPVVCARTLFDPDFLDEGKQLFGKAAPVTPLRLARRAVPASLDTFDQCGPSGCPSVWAPRLLGRPRTATYEPDDGSAWPPNEAVVAMLNTMVEPTGSHTFDGLGPCKHFDESHYLTNIVGHFFLTRGKDVYYLSHPASHHCMERLDCAEMH